MFSLNNLSKSYGSRILFDGVSFTLGSRERVGLVGRNGHGKTTLLNIVAGMDSADSGDITVPRGYKTGYLAQKLVFSHKTVREEAVSSLPEDKADFPYLAEKILFGLGFDGSQLDLSPSQLSGGFQVRLNLGKLLISEPHLLLLDEPTNYLDILSVRWLKQFLINWRGELMIVTHDREFMDSVCTHIAGIHRQKIRKIQGGTEKYYDQIAQDEEIYEKTRLNDEAKRKDMEVFIRRFRAKARLAGMVQSRIKTMEKMDKKNKLEALEELEFSFRYKDVPSETLIQADKISFGYDKGKSLFSELSFTLNKGDRLCIVGKNGAGKSTLLRVLAGKLSPSEGIVRGREDINGGYFEQTNMLVLNDESTVEDEIAKAGDYRLDKTAVRNIAAAMMFSGDDALKKMKVLSGGEKSRVMLGKILAKPVSYLLLDEPTNHIDMDAADSLLEAIDSFPGGVALVTHNETYLNALATRLIVFQGEKPFIFEGTYAEFLEKTGWEEDMAPKSASKSGKKGLRKARADIIAEKSRVLKPLETKIEEAETDIMELEGQIKALEKEIEAATAAMDGRLLHELGAEIAVCYSKVDLLYDKLSEVTVEYDTQTAFYDGKLKGIDES